MAHIRTEDDIKDGQFIVWHTDTYEEFDSLADAEAYIVRARLTATDQQIVWQHDAEFAVARSGWFDCVKGK